MLKFDKDKTLSWAQLFQLGKQNISPKNKAKILLSKIIIFLTVIQMSVDLIKTPRLLIFMFQSRRITGKAAVKYDQNLSGVIRLQFIRKKLISLFQAKKKRIFFFLLSPALISIFSRCFYLVLFFLQAS